MFGRRLYLALIAVSVSVLAADIPDDPKQMSVMDIMQTVITPATNTMWSIEAPESEADWAPFEEAASLVIAAGRRIREGGTGPVDAQWAADPRWTAWADSMIAAAEDALNAARDRKLEAYVEATDVMYPPCEECHLQFNPALQ